MTTSRPGASGAPGTAGVSAAAAGTGVAGTAGAGVRGTTGSAGTVRASGLVDLSWRHRGPDSLASDPLSHRSPVGHAAQAGAHTPGAAR